MTKKSLIKFIIVIILIFRFAAGVSLLPVKEKEEYYRGVYDTCMMIVVDTATCLQNVQNALKNFWYEDPSPGWDWKFINTINSETEV